VQWIHIEAKIIHSMHWPYSLP